MCYQPSRDHSLNFLEELGDLNIFLRPRSPAFFVSLQGQEVMSATRFLRLRSIASDVRLHPMLIRYTRRDLHTRPLILMRDVLPWDVRRNIKI